MSVSQKRKNGRGGTALHKKKSTIIVLALATGGSSTLALATASMTFFSRLFLALLLYVVCHEKALASN